jgi:hypothetical protein
MARDITVLPNTDAPDTDYPNGRLKDKVGSNPGTRVNEAMVGDWSQFFAKLMRETGATYNNLPDNEYSGQQLYTALLGVFGGLRRTVVEIGSWDMDADQDKIVSTDVPFAQVRLVSFSIIADNGTLVIDAGGIISSGVDSSGDLQVQMSRGTGTIYDSTGFDDTSINRGYLIIDYAP